MPRSRGNGRGARERRGSGGMGVFMGGMVARRIEGMGFRVREEAGGEAMRGGGNRGGWGKRGGGFWARKSWHNGGLV